jgi:uncharacterized protein (UPF0333 family)
LIMENQLLINIAVLVVIAVLIYYLKTQAGDTISPAEGVMSILGASK